MKRFIAWVLVFTFLIGLIGCSQSAQKTEAAAETNQQQNDWETEKTADNTVKTTDQPVSELEPDQEPEQEPDQEPELGPEPKTDSEPAIQWDAFDETATIEETVLFDDQGIKITVTGLEFKYDTLAVLSLIIENSNDFDVSISSGTFLSDFNSINGYMVNGYLSADITAGKKTLEEIYYDIGELKLYGIKGISIIELGFNVRKKGEYETLLKIGPIALNTSFENSSDIGYAEAIAQVSLQKEYNYSLDYFSEDVALSNNALKLKSVSLLANKEGQKRLYLEIENTSDKTVVARVGDVAINEILLTSGNWSSDVITPGKTRVMELNIELMARDENVFRLLELDKVSRIELLVSAVDEDDKNVGESDLLSIMITDSVAFTGEKAKDVYNDNDIQIRYIGAVNDAHSYSDNEYIVFLVTNNAGEDRRIDIEYTSISINDFMADALTYDGLVKAGKTALMIIELTSPDEIKLSSCDDIQTIEFKIEIETVKYKTIATAPVSIKIGE